MAFINSLHRNISKKESVKKFQFFRVEYDKLESKKFNELEKLKKYLIVVEIL